MNPVTVHLFDINTNMVGTRFLDMRCTKSQASGTAVLTKLQLSFHLITQVQTWVFTILLRPQLFLKLRTITLWDAYVISYITAHKGSVGFTRDTKFDIEDFCIDIYFYFNKNTKRKTALQSYAEFSDQEYHDILNHLNGRWLSLERAVERILLQ